MHVRATFREVHGGSACQSESVAAIMKQRERMAGREVRGRERETKCAYLRVRIS